MKYFLPILFIFFAPIVGLTPTESLQILVDGNNRYVTNKLLFADHSSDKRLALIGGQKPFGIILSCSDSRVIPEIVFDQSAGNLFVVRIAGNVAGSVELESIEFAAKVFESSIIVVLGHESCGAVRAVLNNKAKDIPAIAALIKPALRKGDNLESAIKQNVVSTVASLKNNADLKKLLDEKKLDIVGGYYKIKTGKIEIL
ncbi:MAG: carbonic anhydrase [Chlamydiae bacterium]|nr:carbonic anhydrase [Chlamydiota bacterium]